MCCRDFVVNKWHSPKPGSMTDCTLWWDLDVNFSPILVPWLKTPSWRCILYRDLPPEWLHITSVPCCFLLCVCVFWRRYLCSGAARVYCCHCTLQAELCVFVMYEISIDFSLPLTTRKHNKKGKFRIILLSLSNSSRYCRKTQELRLQEAVDKTSRK